MTVVPRLPPFAPGMRIGLLGGSFNPPHQGHALITRLALRRLALDRIMEGEGLDDVIDALTAERQAELLAQQAAS